MTRQHYVIGITGNIACGKSLILQTLRELGAETIDADLVAHEVMRHGTPTWERIVAHFGQEIVGPDGEIDRRRLGGIVFSDPAQLAALDQITHPPVVEAIQQRIEASDHDVVAVDAIKLFEAGIDRLCDEVWAVTCPPEVQVDRLMQRNNISRDDALMRINAQPPQEDKVRLANRTIDNGGAAEQTREQVLAAWDEVQRRIAARASS